VAGAIAHSATALADAAVSLYQDRERWTQAQEHGRQLLARRYDQNIHGPALVECLEQCRNDLAAHRRNNFTGSMLRHHAHKSTQYMSQWIEAKTVTFSASGSVNIVTSTCRRCAARHSGHP